MKVIYKVISSSFGLESFSKKVWFLLSETSVSNIVKGKWKNPLNCKILMQLNNKLINCIKAQYYSPPPKAEIVTPPIKAEIAPY